MLTVCSAHMMAAPLALVWSCVFGWENSGTGQEGLVPIWALPLQTLRRKLVPGTWLCKPDPEHELVPERLHRYRLCYFWHMSGFNLEARPWMQSPGSLFNSVLCVALWSEHKILDPFLPLPVQEATRENTSLWWGTNILFLGWSFYHRMALVRAVTTHAVEGLVIQATASAQSNFLITQLCSQCGFL